MRHLSKHPLAVFAAMLAFGAIGCGSTVGDYCEAWAECEGGNDRDREACVQLEEGEGGAASAYDCFDEWVARMECLEKYSTCDDSDPSNPDFDDNDACDSERDKLNACIEAASANDP